MKRTKRWLAALLSVVLLLGLTPVTALAEEEPATAPWAEDAVAQLKTIYGSAIGSHFSASTAVMETADAAALLTAVGSGITVTEPFNRREACDILARLYNLPLGENESAICFLYDKGIINGYQGAGSAEVGQENPINHAEFAVLMYRVLNFVGSGEGFSDTAKGQDGVPLSGDEFFCWMYLYVRGCMEARDKPAGTVTSDTWNKWRGRLTDNRGRLTDNNAPAIPEWETGSGTKPGDFTGTTNVEAAVHIVKTYFREDFAKKKIFKDVDPTDWYYDGVMYFLNRGDVVGVGEGYFGIDPTVRLELAMLLARIDDGFTATGQNMLKEAIQYVVRKGYMKVSGNESAPDFRPTDDVYWSGTEVRRDEAVYAVMQLTVTPNDLARANTAILDRFTADKDKITPGYEKALAFSVSRGLLNGTDTSSLSPDGNINRAEISVFIYRVLIGLDSSKMRDYDENVKAVLPDAATPEGETK